jgi:putative phosphoribosyl transferase
MNREFVRPLESGALFRDRRDAGATLATHLKEYRGQDTLVLGIARGGVVVAAEVARRLGADLDVAVARKLGAPYQAELAIGAVTASGGRVLNDEMIERLGVPASYVQAVTETEMLTARKREASYREGRPMPRIHGRTVLLVDDGLATGSTMRAVVRSVRQHRPARLVVAVPVGSRQACMALLAEADEVVCPFAPEPFYALGQFYVDFASVEDDEVRAALSEFGPAHHKAV